MYTVGKILEKNRLTLGFSLEEISKKTKIPQKYLQAFETDNYRLYPNEPYCSLHIKNYANFLSLNPENILALHRRDFANYQKTTHSKTKNHLGILNPNRVFALATLVGIFVLLLYLLVVYLQFNQPPKLHVNWPLEIKSTDITVKISGNTSKDATIRINQELVLVKDGYFEKGLFVGPGENYFIVESQGRNGLKTTDSRTINKP